MDGGGGRSVCTKFLQLLNVHVLESMTLEWFDLEAHSDAARNLTVSGSTLSLLDLISDKKTTIMT